MKIRILFTVLVVAQLLIANTTNAQIPINGLVAYYPFTGNAIDSSGNGHNGTVSGATLTTDRFGKANSAYSFNGTSNYITIPASTVFIQNPLTYSFWFNTSGLGPGCVVNYNSQTIFSTGSYTQSREAYFNGTNGIVSRGLGVRRSIPSGCNNEIVDSISITNGSWNHAVVMYDSTKVTVYLNGNLIGSIPFTCAVTTSSTTSYIGTSNPAIWACIAYFNGKIDDIRIYNRDLSGSEILALYNEKGYGVVHTNISSFYPLTASSGTTVTIKGKSFTSSSSVSFGGTTATSYTVVNDSTITAIVGSGTSGNVQVISPNGTASLAGFIYNNVIVTDSLDAYNNFIFSAQNVSTQRWTIWKKNLQGVYAPLFNDYYSRQEVAVSADLTEMIYVRFRPNLNYPNVTSSAMANKALDSAWICRSNIDGSNEKILFLAPNFNRDAIYDLDWSTDKDKIVFVQGNDEYPLAQTRDGDVFLYTISTNTITNLTNDWDLAEWSVRFSKDNKSVFYSHCPNSWFAWPNDVYNKGLSNGNTSQITTAGNHSQWAQVATVTNTLVNDSIIYHRDDSVNNGNLSKGYTYIKSATSSEVGISSIKSYAGIELENGKYATIDDSSISLFTSGGILKTFYFPQISTFFTADWRYNYNAAAFVDVKWLGKLAISCSISGFNPLQDTVRACGDSVVLNAGAGYSNYNWSNGATTQSITVKQSGTYKVTVTNASGCAGVDSSYVSIVKANILNKDTTICKGSSIILSVASDSTIILNSTLGRINKTDPNEIPKNKWTYIAITKGANNDANIFINGKLSFAGSYSNENFNWYRIDLGADYYTSYIDYFKGMIDEVKMSNIVRPASYFLNNYTSGAPQTSDANTIGLWHFDESTGSTTNATVGTGGSLSNTVFKSGKFGNGLYFNGVNSYTTIPQSVPTSNMTFEFWINPDTVQTSWPISWYGMYTSGYILNATVKQSYKYLWSTGDSTTSINVTPTKTTTYYVTVTDGITVCNDSVKVTVSQPIINTSNVSGCNSLVYKGMTYTGSATERDTVRTKQGCDSIYNIANITVNLTTSGDTIATVCNSINWYSTTYNVSGSYIHTLKNVKGCDSVLNLHLTVKLSSSSTTNLTVYSNQLPYTWNGLIFSTAGSQTKHLNNAVGCDSAATLNLTVIAAQPKTLFIAQQNACNGGTVSVPVLMKNIKRVVGFQGSVKFDKTILKYTGITNGIGNISPSVIDTAIGKIGFLWVDPLLAGVTYPDSTVAFSVKFNVLANYTGKTALTFDTIPTALEIDTVETGTGLSHKTLDTAFINGYINFTGITSKSNNSVIICPSALPFKWNGLTFNASGSQTAHFTNSTGCDSAATMVLTVKPNATTSTVNVSGCNSVVYKGVTYTVSTTVRDTVKSKMGCDSIYNVGNIKVTTINPVTNYISLSNCNQLIYKGITYYNSGIATDTVRSYQGCDSVYNVLLITINNIKPKTTTAIIYGCNSVSFRGVNYTSTTSITDTAKSYQGCDSMYNVTVINVKTIVAKQYPIFLSGCNSVTYKGVIYYANTIVKDTVKSYLGCDSIYNIATIVINKITLYTGSVNLNSCDTVIYKGVVYNNSISFIDTTKSVGGCDSIYTTVNITINNMSISGGVYHPSKGYVIPNVSAIMTGSASANNISTGNYSFNCVPQAANEIIRLYKNNEITKANGVTALDIAMVQSHILAKSLLNSPYKILAADVSGDGKVTALDIVYMKRLILGIDTTFTNSTTKQTRLWAFVDSSYKFVDTTNPFPFKDSISYTGLSASKSNQTFIGCKLGDVNWDWNPAVARPQINNTNTVELTYDRYPSDALAGRTDGYVHIPIKVKNFKNMLGIQYTINFNSSVLKWVGIDNNMLNFETGTNHSAEGKVSFLWVDAKNEVKTLEDGSVIFNLVFEKTGKEAIGKEAIENTLSVDGSITSIAAYDKDYGLHGVVMKASPITIVESPKETWTVSPNPTKDGVIKIQMNLKDKKTVVFRLIDNTGRVLFVKQVEGMKGSNNIILREGNIDSGTYFLEAHGIEGVKQLRIEN